jgi:UDP-2,3-diacylglucosamine pyrophosphatase LpxH
MAISDNPIKYVCLSDLHLGEEDSLLTDVNVNHVAEKHQIPAGAPLMEKLCDCIRRLLEGNAAKPKLILAGDTFEMSLALPNQAFMVFDQFLRLFGPLFEEIIFIPGNHDHHIWEVAREAQYARYVAGEHRSSGKPIDPGSWFPVPWHSTYAMEPTDLPISLIETIKGRHNGKLGTTDMTDLKVNCVYPNYIVFGEKQCVVFSHGHYVEPIYWAGSRLRCDLWDKERLPENVDALEVDNFAWIEFFWSTLGQTNRISRHMETLYDSLDSPSALSKCAAEMVRHLIRRVVNVWGPGEMMGCPAALAARLIARRGLLERKYGKPLSIKAEEGVAEYLDTFVWKQIQKEKESSRRSLTEKQNRLNVQNLPEEEKERLKSDVKKLQRIDSFNPESADFAFVFGHTHKPLVKEVRVHQMPQGKVIVHNAGGWVIEGTEPSRVHGASIVLVDESLNTVSVGMYTETEPVVHVLGNNGGSLGEHVVNCIMDRVFRKFESVVQSEASGRYKVRCGRRYNRMWIDG